MDRLDTVNLGQIPPGVVNYKPHKPKKNIGIVHFGPGAFHRAHQALYTDEAMNLHGGDWGISCVGLKSPTSRDQLQAQDGLYCLVEKDSNSSMLRIVSSIQEVLYAADDRAQIINRLTSPDVKIVSLTITEKGYYRHNETGELLRAEPDIIHDIKNIDQPITALGFIIQALSLRRAAGVKPFTVLSCDNIPSNGAATRRVILSLAETINPELSQWIAREVQFPSSMVDRITPSTSREERERICQLLGFDDRAVTVCEPFKEWVIEDNFIHGRPQWEKAGARFVMEVEPYEQMKLRLLNGSHSMLAYLGCLADIRYIYECMDHPSIQQLISSFMYKEVMPTLNHHNWPLLPSYFPEVIIKRFANRTIKHQASQVAMDGSIKIPIRLLATIKDLIAIDKPYRRSALGVALWIVYIGKHYLKPEQELKDPLAQTLQSISQRCQGQAEALLAEMFALQEIFPQTLTSQEVFRDTISYWVKELLQQDTLSVINTHFSV